MNKLLSVFALICALVYSTAQADTLSGRVVRVDRWGYPGRPRCIQDTTENQTAGNRRPRTETGIRHEIEGAFIRSGCWSGCGGGIQRSRPLSADTLRSATGDISQIEFGFGVTSISQKMPCVVFMSIPVQKFITG